ncbi:hypothetical protein CJJ19_09220 [Candidatus Williamhamiltonella defendens]|nr:PriCT-2 domain-containing protein [Candidatus Hamiltonella defensa]AYB49592.1 hypothetical protein CJJ19_09220 [Candidatus Hamiltonella defensa]
MTGSNNTSYLKEYGERLLQHGYPIIPIKQGFKFPKGLSGWEQINATENHLKKWLSNGFAQGGVGILTKHTPAIDLDVQDLEILPLLIAWCEKHIGPTVQRVGNAPKSLLVYRTEKPFTKMASHTYEDFLGLQHRIEILGDGQQFVAFATHPDTGKPYEWVTEQNLADIRQDQLPLITVEQAQALIDYFESIIHEDWERVDKGQSGKVKDNGLTDSERLLNHLKPKVNVSTERLKTALEEVDAEDYHEWVRVGMALYHQYSGDITGFELWDEWSQRSSKYNPHEMKAKWQTFEANLLRQEPVTAATILRMARIAEEQSKGDLLDAFLKQYVYVQDGDRLCDLNKPPHCSISRFNEFKNRTANIRHEISAPTQQDPDRIKLDPVWKAWLLHPKRRSAEGTVYIPKRGRVITDDYGLDWINEFHMPEFLATTSRENLAIFFEHMNYMFPKEVEKEWFISWMAFNLQYPERRCKVTPLHVSVAHGTGRGWIVELLKKLLGKWNVKKTKMNVLMGEGNGSGFHDFLHNSLLCAVEEVKEGSKRFSISDRIRDLLTENDLEVNIKYGSQKTQEVYTNFFFMSNHPDALVLTKEDRRINVFFGPDRSRDKAYYKRLYEWLETHGVDQLYHYLMKLDLTDFDWTHSIDTESRARMIENNRTETEVLFWEFMENPLYPAMTFRQIIREMGKLSDKGEFAIDETQLTKLLQHHAQHINKNIKIQGKPIRPWVLIQGLELDNKKIRKSIEEYGV